MAFDISKLDEAADLSGGEWIDDIEDAPGARLKVRSHNYKPYQNELDRLRRKAGKKGIKMPALGEAQAKFILLDWDFSEASGPIVLEQDGKVLPYSPELALKVLTSEDNYGIGAKFRDAVYEASVAVADKLISATDEAAGN